MLDQKGIRHIINHRAIVPQLRRDREKLRFATESPLFSAFQPAPTSLASGGTMRETKLLRLDP
jgi:hypothetical protein